METKQITEFSRAVRDSTLKRLAAVPEGLENWRISANAMSFSDIAQHLVDADNWLFSKLKDGNLAPIKGKAGSIKIASRREYTTILEELHRLGKRRSDLLEGLTEAELQNRIYDARFGGEVSVWWIIMRGNLDHETHHRGQLAAYLRVLLDSGYTLLG